MSSVYAPPAFEKSARYKFPCNIVDINLLVVLVCEHDGRGMACTLGKPWETTVLVIQLCASYITAGWSAPPAPQIIIIRK